MKRHKTKHANTAGHSDTAHSWNSTANIFTGDLKNDCIFETFALSNFYDSQFSVVEQIYAEQNHCTTLNIPITTEAHCVTVTNGGNVSLLSYPCS